jgi:Mn2+/Fe2+ NRAMP family transporter
MSIIRLLQILGPGIIAASAAIGNSHLIQSTRAGGYFGFELLWVVVAINILKYPFIEYGYRYTAATGENILHGYKKLNPKLLLTFIIVNIFAAIGAIAVTTYVCAGIMKSSLHLPYDIKFLAFIVMIVCILVIAIGHYKYLDHIMKFFMIFLLLSTFTALTMALSNYSSYSSTPSFYQESAWSFKYLPFIIALMGWMPGPIELSVWHSLWLEARNKSSKKQLTFKEARIDFNIGYLLMIVTAAVFLSLGGLVLHHSGVEISGKANVFASQFINVYSSTIGSWSKGVVAIAVLAAILSTTLAVIDIYPRSVAVGIMIARGKNEDDDLKYSRNFRLIAVISFCVISYLVIYFLVSDFRTLIDIVTILSFLFAPLFAYMNYRLVTSKLLKKEYHPSRWLKTLSYLGFIYMSVFCLIFLVNFFK